MKNNQILKLLRERNNIPKASLAKTLDKADSVVGCYEAGSLNINHKSMQQIIDYFTKIDPYYFDYLQSVEPMPVLDEQANVLEDYVPQSNSFDALREHFAILISSDKYEPFFKENDLIIVEKQLLPKNGSVCAVQTNNHNITLNRVFRNEDLSITLFPLNEDEGAGKTYSIEEQISTPVNILGKIIQLKRAF